MTIMAPLTSHVGTIADLFSAGYYVPAAVQRDYQWGERECELLLADLDRALHPVPPAPADDAGPANGDQEEIDTDLRPQDNQPADGGAHDYFLGAIVTRRLPDGRIEIFDGLQRLTTLTVLVAVLRDVSAPDAKKHLQNLITCSKGLHRLTLPGRDRTLIDEVQTPREAIRMRRGHPRTELCRRIRAAARTLRKEVMSWPASRVAEFTNFLLTRVGVVVVDTTDPKLARQIFITTNLRGVPLDQVALFKGQLIDIAPDEETATEMVRHWAGIQQAVGRDIEGFLLAMDFIERRAHQGADCLTLLADHLASKPGPAGILKWVGRLAMYAGAWRELMQKMSTPRADALDKDIWRLRFFKWNEWKPLALLWYADAFIKGRKANGARTDVHTARRFDALHRRCMAIALAEYSDVDRSTIFRNAIQQVLRRRDPLNGALTFNPSAQDKMRQALTRPLLHDENRLTLVRWLESMSWGASAPAHIAGATVEHILPQRPGSRSQWITAFPDEGDRYDACHSLGNLGAMDYDKNQEIENFEFAAKRPIIADQSAKYKTLTDVAAQTSWSPKIVQERTDRMIKQVWDHLQLPARP